MSKNGLISKRKEEDEDTSAIQKKLSKRLQEWDYTLPDLTGGEKQETEIPIQLTAKKE